ncbi:MAG: hypothetical protein KAU23_11885 [Anaerolineales bacterium]|nr:hypothetical protein [Anaerolineales bacterium]
MFNQPELTLKQIFNTWWPLAVSWFLMALELPALSAIVARLPYPKVNLAAYGGIVFPLALIIEAPIIMLLAASTALSKDWKSYTKIRRFMHTTSAVLTVLHILVVSTPIYFFVVEKLIGSPEEIILPARLGLAIMLPWTWSIAYRRFNQGVLIRFGHSVTVGKGTSIRLFANIAVLSIGYFAGTIPGIVVATSAVSAGVICEAIYIGIKVKPVIKTQLIPQPEIKPELSRKAFLQYYIPLALTSLITLLSQPLVSSALSRMPRALDSLAIWPVLSGLLFIFRSVGIAYNEVVVTLIDKPNSYSSLRKYAFILVSITSGLLLLFTATPLSTIWFKYITALPASLIPLAKTALWFSLLIPGANAFQSWYQGIILHSGKTRGIPEAVALFLTVTIIAYLIGIYLINIPGLYIGVIGFSLGMVSQAAWLKFRSRRALSAIYGNANFRTG